MNNSSFFLIIFLFIVIIFAIDLYVFQGVKTVISGFGINQMYKLVCWGYWIVSALIMINLFIALSRVMMHQHFTGTVQWAFNIFLVFTISKLVFVLILLGEDLFRGAVSLSNILFHRDSLSPIIPGRIRFISQLGIITTMFIFSSLTYGVLKGKYKYKLHKHTIYFEDLPDSFDGFTIAQISDVHVGSFNDPHAVQQGIDMIKAQRADMFVFTGDIVNNKAEELIPYMGHFSQIRAPYGQYSILGNHDYGEYVRWKSKDDEEANLKQLIHLHSDLGYKLMLNENLKIEKNGEFITLLGVENWGKGFVTKGDLNKALEGVEDTSFKILLSHDPSHWDEEVKNHSAHIHLTLSGHTHGMQMGIETSWFRFSPVQLRYKNWAGLTNENDKYLYVNRGFGFIGYFGRIGIWPEITLFELRKKV